VFKGLSSGEFNIKADHSGSPTTATSSLVPSGSFHKHPEIVKPPIFAFDDLFLPPRDLVASDGDLVPMNDPMLPNTNARSYAE
jgi:hypothetical protein